MDEKQERKKWNKSIEKIYFTELIGSLLIILVHIAILSSYWELLQKLVVYLIRHLL